MSNEQQSLQRGTIDDRLFVPLSNFFEDDSDFELGNVMSAVELPERLLKGSLGHCIDFAFETYVKSALKRFAKVTSCPLSPSQFRRGRIGTEGAFYVTNDWGNMIFYRQFPILKYPTLKLAELDALYEFNNDGILSTPIILEVTTSYSTFHNKEQKRRLVTQLYNSPPYFCEIRLRYIQRLSTLPNDPYHKRISIPNRGEFFQLATELFVKGI